MLRYRAASAVTVASRSRTCPLNSSAAPTSISNCSARSSSPRWRSPAMARRPTPRAPRSPRRRPPGRGGPGDGPARRTGRRAVRSRGRPAQLVAFGGPGEAEADEFVSSGDVMARMRSTQSPISVRARGGRSRHDRPDQRVGQLPVPGRAGPARTRPAGWPQLVQPGDPLDLSGPRRRRDAVAGRRTSGRAPGDVAGRRRVASSSAANWRMVSSSRNRRPDRPEARRQHRPLDQISSRSTSSSAGSHRVGGDGSRPPRRRTDRRRRTTAGTAVRAGRLGRS